MVLISIEFYRIFITSVWWYNHSKEGYRAVKEAFKKFRSQYV